MLRRTPGDALLTTSPGDRGKTGHAQPGNRTRPQQPTLVIPPAHSNPTTHHRHHPAQRTRHHPHPNPATRHTTPHMRPRPPPRRIQRRHSAMRRKARNPRHKKPNHKRAHTRLTVVLNPHPGNTISDLLPPRSQRRSTRLRIAVRVIQCRHHITPRLLRLPLIIGRNRNRNRRRQHHINKRHHHQPPPTLRPPQNLRISHGLQPPPHHRSHYCPDDGEPGDSDDDDPVIPGPPGRAFHACNAPGTPAITMPPRNTVKLNCWANCA